jgi:hypothetical protein
MQLLLKDDLPFSSVTVTYQGQSIEVSNVLIDTGSGTTTLAADMMRSIQIIPSPKDTL